VVLAKTGLAANEGVTKRHTHSQNSESRNRPIARKCAPADTRRVTTNLHLVAVAPVVVAALGALSARITKALHGLSRVELVWKQQQPPSKSHCRHEERNDKPGLAANSGLASFLISYSMTPQM
jgi:hypothetical protein